MIKIKVFLGLKGEVKLKLYEEHFFPKRNFFWEFVERLHKRRELFNRSRKSLYQKSLRYGLRLKNMMKKKYKI